MENKLKELVKESGMSQRAFAEYFEIPKITVQTWCRGISPCSPYLTDLMEYKLKRENIIKWN